MEEHLPIQNQVGLCLHEQCVAVFGALETSSTTSQTFAQFRSGSCSKKEATLEGTDPFYPCLFRWDIRFTISCSTSGAITASTIARTEKPPSAVACASPPTAVIGAWVDREGAHTRNC